MLISRDFPSYISAPYVAKGLASIREGAEKRMFKARFENNRHAEAHAQGVMDGIDALAKGIDHYFASGLGLQESPYVQGVAVAAVVEGLCLGLLGFALWCRELPEDHVELDLTPPGWGRFEMEGYHRVYEELLEDNPENRLVSIEVGVHRVRVVLFEGEYKGARANIPALRGHLRTLVEFASNRAGRDKLMAARSARIDLLERIAKYAKEDGAETPGSTRLARALSQLERNAAEMLQAASGGGA